MEFANFKTKICEAFKRHIGINLNENQVMHFYAFMEMLIEKNKVMNLTAITEPDEIIIRHFVDSCMIYKFYDEELKSCRRVVDIGTGAGFPGLPIAIVASGFEGARNIEFVLTDSLSKRVDFIRDVLDATGLKNATTIHLRAEDFCHNIAYRETFDLALSRGVAKLSVLSEYCLPTLKLSGKMISYKMNDIESELSESQNAIKTLGGKFHEKHSYDLIPDEPSRCLIEIEKISKTPKSYPRKAGTPSRNPL